MLMRLGAGDGSPEAQAERDAIAARQDEIYRRDFERRAQEQQLRLQQEAFDINKAASLRKEARVSYSTSRPLTTKSVSYSASPRDLPAVGYSADTTDTSNGGYSLSSTGGKVILVAGVVLAAIFIARN